MATRNFWIEAVIDGRACALEGGPAAKDGGFELTINIRENGAISDRKLKVCGVAMEDGSLSLRAWEAVPYPQHTEARICLESHR